MSRNQAIKIGKINLLVLAIGATLFIIFSVHSVAKLPDEPFWASPALLMENWEFAIGVGLGLPFSEVTAPLILFLVLGLNYLIIKRILKVIIRMIKATKRI